MWFSGIQDAPVTLPVYGNQINASWHNNCFYNFSTVTRTRSPALMPCPLGMSMLNQRAFDWSCVVSCDIRQSLCSLMSATNSIPASTLKGFPIQKKGAQMVKLYRSWSDHPRRAVRIAPPYDVEILADLGKDCHVCPHFFWG